MSIKSFDQTWNKLKTPSLTGGDYIDHQSLFGAGDYTHDYIDDIILGITKSYASTFPSGITLANTVALKFENATAAADAQIVETAGNVLAVTTGSSGMTITGATTITGNTSVVGNFYIGDDAYFTDINVANYMGLYGQANAAVGGLKLGSGGATLYGTGNTLIIDSQVVINEASADYDVRIEGNGNQNLFFTDAGNDRVCVGRSTPTTLFEVFGTRAADNTGQVLIYGNADHTYLDIQSSSPSTKETGIHIVGMNTIAAPDWAINTAANASNLLFRYRGTEVLKFNTDGDIVASNNVNLYLDNSTTGSSIYFSVRTAGGVSNTPMYMYDSVVNSVKIVPRTDKVTDLGITATARWDNVYADDFVNESGIYDYFDDVEIIKSLQHKKIDESGKVVTEKVHEYDIPKRDYSKVHPVLQIRDKEVEGQINGTSINKTVDVLCGAIVQLEARIKLLETKLLDRG